MKEAVSFRTRKTSIYDKKSNTPFKISRSKFFNFLSCKRCFYLDRVKGLKEPSMPGWALNVAVDELLKKEFDLYRKEQKPHPIMIKHNLNYVPYQHKDLDTWRNSLRGGISYLDEKTNLIIHGGIDDLWFDLNEKKLVVVGDVPYDDKYSREIKSYSYENLILTGYIRNNDELNSLYQNLKGKNKVLLCDDYGKASYIPEVERAINDFSKKQSLKINVIENRFAEIIT